MSQQTARQPHSTWFSHLLDHLRLPLFRNGYALILSAGTTSALGVLYWILAARQYPEETVGLNSAAISAMMLLSGIAQLNLRSPLIRFIPRAGTATTRLVAYSYGVTLIVAVVSSLIFCIGLKLWSPALLPLVTSPIFIPWFIAATMGWNIFVLQDNTLTGLRRTVWIPVENTGYALAKLVLLIVFAASLPTYGIFASWTLPMLVLLLPVNYVIFRRFIPQHIRETREKAVPISKREVVQFAAGDYVGSLFTLASTVLLPVIVTQLAGAKANAYFYLPWTICSSLLLVAANMSSSLTVEAVLDEHKLYIYTRRVLVNTLRLLVPLVMIFVVGAPYILQLFGTNYALEGATLLRLLALSALPNTIIVLYIGVARVQSRVRSIMVLQGAVCALVIGISIALLPMHGINGVGLGWLVGQVLVAGMLAVWQLKLRRDI